MDIFLGKDDGRRISRFQHLFDGFVPLGLHKFFLLPGY